MKGLEIAILATDGVEEIKLPKPREAFEAAGAIAEFIAPEPGKITSYVHLEASREYAVDRTLADANVERYDALVLPGGVVNSDRLRTIAEAVAFTRAFFDLRKPVAAICHGPWLAVEADVIRGCTLTSWPSLQTDVRSAGGTWVGREVASEGNLVTSRKPDDLPAFNEAAIALFERVPRPCKTADDSGASRRCENGARGGGHHARPDDFRENSADVERHGDDRNARLFPARLGSGSEADPSHTQLNRSFGKACYGEATWQTCARSHCTKMTRAGARQRARAGLYFGHVLQTFRNREPL